MLGIRGRWQMSPGLHGATSFAGKQDWNIGSAVRIALRHAGTEKHQRVVEQAAAAFINRGHLIHHALESLNVPTADDLVLAQQLRIVAVM